MRPALVLNSPKRSTPASTRIAQIPAPDGLCHRPADYSPPWIILVQIDQPQPQRHPLGLDQGRRSLDRGHCAGLYLRAGNQGPGRRHDRTLRAAGRPARPLPLRREKGYSAWASTAATSPAMSWSASARTSSTPRAAMWRRASTRPRASCPIISAYFPSGSSGELRQTAKFRFLAEMHEHLMRMKGEREFILCATSTSPTSRSTSRTGAATRKTAVSRPKSASG